MFFNGKKNFWKLLSLSVKQRLVLSTKMSEMCAISLTCDPDSLTP